MNIHTYQTSGGKDLIIDYLDNLPQDEGAEGYLKGVFNMAFKKINVKQIVDEKIRNDKEFERQYKQVEKEYKLIEQVIIARKNKGMTQKDLADKIGVKQQVISRFENEKHAPTLDNLINILDGLDLELKIKEKVGKKEKSLY